MIALLVFGLIAGSVHVVWQWGLVMIVTTCFYPRIWEWTLKTVLLTGLFTFPLVFTVLLHSPYVHQNRVIFCGWGCPSGDVQSRGFWHLWDGLTRKYTIDVDASWEQTLYVGPFVFVYVLLLWRLPLDRFDAVFLAVGLLCVGPVLGWLYNPTGLPVVDRLPTRLAIYPFTWFLYRALKPSKHKHWCKVADCGCSCQ